MKEEEAAAKGGQAPKSPKSGRMGTHLHWVSKPWHRASGFRGLGRGVMPVLPLNKFWIIFGSVLNGFLVNLNQNLRVLSVENLF